MEKCWDKKDEEYKQIRLQRKKSGSLFYIEFMLKTSTYAIVAVEIVSIIGNAGTVLQPLRIVGIMVAILGDMVFALAVFTMRDSWRAGIAAEDQTEMVTEGIYKYSRNPAFLGFDLVYIGILLMFFNWILCVFTILAITMLHLQILQEEQYLTSAFGCDYTVYKNKAGRYFMGNGKRSKYTIGFLIFFLIELFIALYVRDDFVRPYMGDVLVVVVLYCFIRMWIPEKGKLLPLYLFVFAAGVEILQYFRIVEHLGLQNNPVLRILIGSVFDIKDILCYGVGCAIIAIIAASTKVRNKKKSKEQNNRKMDEYMNGRIRSTIKIGAKVQVVQKQDQRSGKLTEGIVMRILTNSPNHTRGIKVMLEGGIVGRVQKIARENGLTSFASMQNHYNLLNREDERELVPICKLMNVARTSYSPLAAGRLSQL